MIELRWLVRGVEKVLQYRQLKLIEGFGIGFGGWSYWQDVPVVEAAEGGDEHDKR